MPRIKRTEPAADIGSDPKTTAKETITISQQDQSDLVQKLIKPKQHRNRPDLAKFGEENTEPGDNSRYLRYALASWDLPPIDISDPKQVEQRIREYFQFCVDNDRKPNIKGLGNWIGVDDETVRRWRTGEYRSETHRGVIKKAVDALQEMWWDYGQNGKCNPASWIFIGKNAFGMRDEQQVVITPNNPLDTADSEQARQKYVQALPDADDGND